MFANNHENVFYRFYGFSIPPNPRQTLDIPSFPTCYLYVFYINPYITVFADYLERLHCSFKTSDFY